MNAPALGRTARYQAARLVYQYPVETWLATKSRTDRITRGAARSKVTTCTGARTAMNNVRTRLWRTATSYRRDLAACHPALCTKRSASTDWRARAVRYITLRCSPRRAGPLGLGSPSYSFIPGFYFRTPCSQHCSIYFSAWLPASAISSPFEWSNFKNQLSSIDHFK